MTIGPATSFAPAAIRLGIVAANFAFTAANSRETIDVLDHFGGNGAEAFGVEAVHDGRGDSGAGRHTATAPTVPRAIGRRC